VVCRFLLFFWWLVWVCLTACGGGESRGFRGSGYR